MNARVKIYESAGLVEITWFDCGAKKCEVITLAKWRGIENEFNELNNQ